MLTARCPYIPYRLVEGLADEVTKCADGDEALAAYGARRPDWARGVPAHPTNGAAVMNRRQWPLRGAQTVAVGAAYAAWLLTQHLLETTRGSVYGFTDHTLWGAMFARRRNVAGVAVSQVLCGWFGFVVLGFEPWY